MANKVLRNVFKLQNTCLWKAIVEQRSKQIAEEICM